MNSYTSDLVNGLSKLKTEFSKRFQNTSHLPEPLPLGKSSLLPFDTLHLDILHKFAHSNPIYHNSFESSISDISCMIYEGDINHYWLDSIKHDTSYAPFYPTWMLSALILALECKKMGSKQVIDVGSGDGRIAYCSQAIGMKSFGLEIDESLILLQNSLAKDTDISFTSIQADATTFDYSKLELSKPVFFLSGLPEVGEMLANSVIGTILEDPNLKKSCTFVHTGTFAIKQYSEDDSKWGWGKVLDKFNLDVKQTIVLPTHWTLDQEKDTPFIFSSPNV